MLSDPVLGSVILTLPLFALYFIFAHVLYDDFASCWNDLSCDTMVAEYSWLDDVSHVTADNYSSHSVMGKKIQTNVDSCSGLYSRKQVQQTLSNYKL